MLLIVAVGSNYALFFDRQAHAAVAGGEPLTLASLVIANAGTVIGFGLLSFSASAGTGGSRQHRGPGRISRAAVRRGASPALGSIAPRHPARPTHTTLRSIFVPRPGIHSNSQGVYAHGVVPGRLPYRAGFC